MKESPILFSAPMIRAILDGRKTQTRPIVKPTRDRNGSGCELATCEMAGEVNRGGRFDLRPYGQPGDRLWVRESWSIEMMSAFSTVNGYDTTYEISYRAGDEGREIHVAPGEPDPYLNLYENRRGDWRPSIHMPRWASRILLEIVSVRVERLNDISEQDARAEGCSPGGWQPSYSNPDNSNGDDSWSASDTFAELWESINGAGSWKANPWVWVVEFKVVEPKSC